MKKLTVEEVYKMYDEDIEDIRNECAEEGYPSNGSNFELRYEQLYNDYKMMYPEIFE